MTRDEIDQIIQEVFSDLFDLPPNSITSQTSPDTLLEWDSLAHVQLVASFEEKIGVTISAENQVEMLNVELIGDILHDLKSQNT
ncbi:MAG: hypothetical protein CMM54_02735 [Rhodospirillaceae bacterium]|nr:hypothetical protein [Rhodospirillaceae bacterium]|tara:strand:- start:1063 stop:1314 length:252 start_codon:yes stop_codon:yes gene_type:complete